MYHVSPKIRPGRILIFAPKDALGLMFRGFHPEKIILGLIFRLGLNFRGNVVCQLYFNETEKKRYRSLSVSTTTFSSMNLELNEMAYLFLQFCNGIKVRQCSMICSGV